MAAENDALRGTANNAETNRDNANNSVTPSNSGAATPAEGQPDAAGFRTLDQDAAPRRRRRVPPGRATPNDVTPGGATPANSPNSPDNRGATAQRTDGRSPRTAANPSRLPGKQAASLPRSASQTAPPKSSQNSSSAASPPPAASKSPNISAASSQGFPQWRNAPRAKRWQGIKPPDIARLQVAQLVAFCAIPLLPLGLHSLWVTMTYFWMRFATGVLRWSMTIPSYHFPIPGLCHALAKWVSEFLPLPEMLFALAHGLDVAVLAVLTYFAAPYFLDLVLPRIYGLQILSIARLGQVSPEAQRRIQSACQKANHRLPRLGLLPQRAPIAFTYGTWDKNTRLILSQGLLDQLQDDEIAAICSGEMRYIHPCNVGLMTWLLALLQVPYLLYGMAAQLADYLAQWAQKQSNRALEILPLVGVYGLAFVAAIAYIVFRTMRWLGLWFARVRSMYADHAGVNLTGNPNAQARALLKIATGMSQDLQAQGQTDFVLEGFELAMPVGYRQAMTLGSLLRVMPPEQALAWERQNPQRRYLTFNNPQALLGDRLTRLMQYAQQWQLPLELALDDQPAQPPLTKAQKMVASLPFWSAAIGHGLAWLCWAVAWLGFWLGVPQLAWLGSDFRPMYAFPLIGFGIGTLVRFNRYFPDLPSSWHRRLPESTDDPIAVVQDALAVPDRANPTALTGRLLGRRGVANWLCQDLFLQCDQILLRLHYPSYLGWLTNLVWAENRVLLLLDQSVSVIGWLRRGATPWFDAEMLRNQYGKTRRGGHQVWSTIVGLGAVTIGLIWLGALEDVLAIIQRLQSS